MPDGSFRNFHTDLNPQGVLTVALDVPDRRHNVFDETVVAELDSLLDRLEHDTGVRLVAFTSAKESGFLTGADIGRIQMVTSAEEARTISAAGQRLFDRLERLPMPTVAVIHGPCLGGGLEFALACTYRVARDDSATRLGLPEVQLGILPAWGGTQRLPREIGIVRALEMILSGNPVSVRRAQKLSLVDATFPPLEFREGVNGFVAEVLARGRPRRRQRLPLRSALSFLTEGTPLGQWLVFRGARRRVARQSRHYPALAAALRAVERGVRGARSEGLEAERDGVAQLLFTDACRHLVELFFLRERARGGGSAEDSKTDEPRPVDRVAIVGAGAMGAGIAQLAAFHGCEVVLKDIDEPTVATGMKRIDVLFDDAVNKEVLRPDEAAARRAAITATAQYERVAEVDLAIEAVVEREDIKRQVFAELDKRLPRGAIIVSNTSSLAIADMAAATSRPDHVGGLHFFNPPHRMPLVEVVRTAATSDETVRRLSWFARRLGKTPVVVHDSPGFLVNRVLFPYLGEAVRMLVEGTPVEEIDRPMRDFGMPMGPLELLDQVGLDVAAAVAGSLAALGSAQPAHVTQPLGVAREAADVLRDMVARGWLGKKSGRGFYHYRGSKRIRPARMPAGVGGTLVEPGEGRDWAARFKPEPALGQHLQWARSPVCRRLVLLVVNEAARCLGEGIVDDPGMVDLAMVLGTGFAPFRGGPLRLADELGAGRVVRVLEHLEQTHGVHYAPCATLREMAREERDFFPQPAFQEAATKGK